MINLRGLLIGLVFLLSNSTILDIRRGVLYFHLFSMRLESEDQKYATVIELILNLKEPILQPGERTKILVKSQIYTDNEATGINQAWQLLEIVEDLSSPFGNTKYQKCGINPQSPGSSVCTQKEIAYSDVLDINS